ncbi:hypothetical protein EDD80_1065 [Anseongella ginsenosidimutans]|uniref:Preprotein translocase subunit SecB n=1 Tax=Anseongella ginsenosidimutans TaxID=496056 RepID=A0A4R3KPQ2_9SPHI|nr:hypothetical protein [Anseongella ginsenosidimutans]QEC52157.1 hypothetical protein FRZ59_07275 [Anseongella ginsenosidimutans]TCS86696.1 hypothetical protein EDD80_1065 [Anseongella ginsenosidimutans]
MESKAGPQFQMRISSIIVSGFSQYEVGAFNIEADDALEFQSEFQVRVLSDSSELEVLTTVKLNIRELNTLFGELKTSVRFKVLPFELVVKKAEEGYQIPDTLMVNLFGIVTGTVRGILYERLRGTILQNEILPLLNPKELIK